MWLIGNLLYANLMTEDKTHRNPQYNLGTMRFASSILPGAATCFTDSHGDLTPPHCPTPYTNTISVFMLSETSFSPVLSGSWYIWTPVYA